MKRFALALVALLSLAVAASYAQLRTPNYMDVGYWGVGGTIEVLAGGVLKISGVDRTTALQTAPAGVAAGYKIARGTVALDGTNPTPVATGLTSVVACTASISSTAAPGLSTSTITVGISGTTLNLYGWKPTGAGDTTLIASTGTDSIHWHCVGT